MGIPLSRGHNLLFRVVYLRQIYVPSDLSVIRYWKAAWADARRELIKFDQPR